MSVPIAFDALDWMAKSTRDDDVKKIHDKEDELSKFLPFKAKEVLAVMLECFLIIFNTTATIAAQLEKMSTLGHLIAFLTHGQAHTSKTDFMPSCLSHDLQCNVTSSFVNAAQASMHACMHACSIADHALILHFHCFSDACS